MKGVTIENVRVNGRRCNNAEEVHLERQPAHLRTSSSWAGQSKNERKRFTQRRDEKNGFHAKAQRKKRVSRKDAKSQRTEDGIF